MEHFGSLSEYLNYLELPPAEHPMFCVYNALGDGFLPCPRKSSPPITTDCYTISFKKILSGNLTYGRTQYDFTHGALFFIAPNQVLQWDDNVKFEQKGFSIHFHKDFLKGTELDSLRTKYGYFSYTVNEALHLSPKEEQRIESIVESIAEEYRNTQDAFSKDIIVSQLATLLRYADRFYERQFIHRKPYANDLLVQFTQYLEGYCNSGQLQANGIPDIEYLAYEMNVSQRYLRDTLKKETGKTTTEHLQLFLIDKAKQSLLHPQKTVAEVAYELGFDYPPYFSRLFKKKEGITPSEYRLKFRLN